MRPLEYKHKNWLEFVSLSDEKLLAFIRVDTYKGSGRGGQKRNKTSSAIRLTLAALQVTDESSREKSINQKRALKKMRLAIALDLPEPIKARIDFTQLPEALHPAIQAGLIRINPSNPVFSLFIGCLLDVFIANQGDWSKTAEFFHTSSSQIRKFIQNIPLLSQKIRFL